MKRIEVMLVEDDPFWIDNLTMDLSGELDVAVVKAVSTKAEAIEAVKTIHIDVILMDINLTENNLDGLEMIKDILAIQSVKVIMLTSMSESKMILDAFESGAVNYITKDNYTDIIRAIRDAYLDKSPLNSNIANVLLKELRLKKLTKTERVIHDLRDEGKSKIEIANSLHRSLETIRSQLKNINKKLK